jgi:hypothetical protein
MFSFSTIKKSGLIHENGDFIVHPTFDKIILLKKVNKFFFGIKETPITNPQYLLMSNIIIKYKDENYLILSKLDKFIEAIGSMENQSHKFLTINYYNFINKEINGIQKDVIDFNNQFISYLNNKKPLYYNTIIKMFGDTFFNGYLVGIENNTNIISIKYDNIIITYGYKPIDMKLYININNNHSDYNQNDYNINSILYEQIKEAYLMMDIDRFVVYNLTKITNNEGFASLLVSSHNNKEDHCIPIYIINTFINFKNNNSSTKYLDRYKMMYKENTIWINSEEDILLNFEGFNKYFLNLELNDLSSINDKEMINDFYYNITNELINSYKTLYYEK